MVGKDKEKKNLVNKVWLIGIEHIFIDYIAYTSTILDILS